MKHSHLLVACIWLVLLFMGEGIEVQGMDNPPPIDSLCVVFSGIDYGSNFSSPQEYPNAKHITNVMVGSYNFPVIIWKTGSSWNGASLFSYWDDMFQYFSYPDSFTSSGGEDTGSGNIWADSKGNLHLAWHQSGNPDGYEIFYTRAFLDTSAGIIQFNVVRPGIIVSETNGISETYPAMCLNDDNPYIVWSHGNVLFWNHSTDGGGTWVGADTAFYDTMLVAGQLFCIAPDPTSGDLWVATSFDAAGDSAMDIVTFHYISSSGIWEKEVAAITPDSVSYAFPAISVDYTGIPGIVFQRNIGSYPSVGPVGLLMFTRKVSGSWIPPETLRFSPDPLIDETSGWPSVGITETNEIYIAFTQDSSSFGFQVFYSKIVPESGIYDTPRRIVSKDNNDSLIGGIFPHMTYNFPVTGPYAGPGISWCSPTPPPTNLYYKHMPLIPTGVEEGNETAKPLLTFIEISPNPFTNKVEIRLWMEDVGCKMNDVSMSIYDVSGRRIRSLVTGDLCSGALLWRAEDDGGRRVKSGIYFVRLRVRERIVTKKLVLLE
ncbi:T9SS type A sorting domain-containing protein [candidate division WOR-3 bacterium]|nr:T9SS type A sorting domain-containing protein [candidate division WOR-3 bacterium]